MCKNYEQVLDEFCSETISTSVLTTTCLPEKRESLSALCVGCQANASDCCQVFKETCMLQGDVLSNVDKMLACEQLLRLTWNRCPPVSGFQFNYTAIKENDGLPPGFTWAQFWDKWESILGKLPKDPGSVYEHLH